jgi:sugar (pentulose or hexulose) kinase
MSVVLGVDLGTTSITALAIDTDAGDVVTRSTRPNQAETTSPSDKARGRSEWDILQIAITACSCLRDVSEQLGGRRRDLAGLGITGQQHGVVLLDSAFNPQQPLINWQDRRGEDTYPGRQTTFVEEALRRVGDVRSRRGCRLAAGYMAVTLFWMHVQGLRPTRACFLADSFAALLTEKSAVTDATCAASSGVFDLAAGDWDAACLEALGLSRSIFPPVRPSGEVLGGLHPSLAESTKLPAGLPVCVGIGDNQASFLGSVASRSDSVLVNVGTGGQVSAFIDKLVVDDALETRTFPRGGFLLVCAGLCGGRSYALLERFFREVGSEVLGASPLTPGLSPARGEGGNNTTTSVYEAMNRLAAGVPRGADGLRCEPFFTGTRAEPTLRASWTGVSAENFTPGHLTRALLEGMARAFRTGHEAIARHLDQPRSRLVGAGNGLRDNPLLADLVAEEFGLPLTVPRHREEAAFGAALTAAVGAGVLGDFDAGGALIRS